MTAKLFDIKLDTRKFNRHLTDIAQRQIPFAVAKTLTMTAKDAQEEIKTEMVGVLTIRSGYVKAGLRITPARKSDGLHRMTAEVGHKDWYMAQQMGKATVTREAKKAEFQFIPRGIRRTKTGKISKANRPANIFKKRNVYFSKNGRDGGSIIQRKAGRTILLYSAIRRQTVKPKMNLQRTAGLVAAKRLDRNFIRAMRSATKFAR